MQQRRKLWHYIALAALAIATATVVYLALTAHPEIDFRMKLPRL